MIDYYKKYLKYKNKYLNYKKKYLLKGGFTTYIFNDDNCAIIKAMILDYWHDNPLLAGTDRSKTFYIHYFNDNTINSGNQSLVGNSPDSIKNLLEVKKELNNRIPLGGDTEDEKKFNYFMGLLQTGKPSTKEIFKLVGASWENHFFDSINTNGVFYAFDQVTSTTTTPFNKCKALHSALHLGDGFAPIKFNDVKKKFNITISEYVEILNKALTISFYKRYGYLDNCERITVPPHFIWAKQYTKKDMEEVIYFSSYVRTTKNKLHNSVLWTQASPADRANIDTERTEVAKSFKISPKTLDPTDDYWYIQHRDTSSCNTVSSLFNI